jgi:RNA polymerase sigma-70 factor (ECF subfamily)
MLKVKNGDLDRLTLLFHRYSKRLYGFFFAMTSNGANSEDLVQNVFMRVLKYRHTYATDGKFESWLFHLARNVHHDHYRKNKRYYFQENMSDWEGQLKEESNREIEMTKEDELGVLQNALNALSHEKRELIELTRFQKLKYEQVAGLLGISESALKVRVHRILKELKENYIKMDT